jgi:hypothetical protein
VRPVRDRSGLIYQLWSHVNRLGVWKTWPSNGRLKAAESYYWTAI